MQLDRPFLKLPIRFDADLLAAEVRALPASAWDPHPTGFAGNEAVKLVSPGGRLTDELEGPMAPTEHLQRCAYIQQVMAELDGVWGRSRLMGLAAGAEVPEHIDTHYYWRTHLRIHVPVITSPAVSFTCGGETVHMAAGECWVFDSFRWHEVHNRGTEQRVHLVLDTVGSNRLWDLLEAAKAGADAGPSAAHGSIDTSRLAFEKVNSPKVMSPWEMRCHLAFLADQVDPSPLLDAVMQRLDKFVYAWAAAWARFGADDSGRATYLALLGEVRRDLQALGGGKLMMRNELPLFQALDQIVLQMAIEAPAPPVSATAAGQRVAS